MSNSEAITNLIEAIKVESTSKLEVARRIAKAWLIQPNKTQRAKADWVDHIAPKLNAAGVEYGYDAARQAVKVGDYFATDTSSNGLDITALDYSYLKFAANSCDTKDGAINELVAFYANGPKVKTVSAFGSQLKASNVGNSRSNVKTSTTITSLTDRLSELLVADFKATSQEQREAFVKAAQAAIKKAQSPSLNKVGPTTIGTSKPKASKPKAANKPSKTAKPKSSRSRKTSN